MEELFETIIKKRFINYTNCILYERYKNDFYTNKFDCLEKVFQDFKNLSFPTKEIFFDTFCKIQKFLHSIHIFKQHIKFKMAKIYNTEDLHMNPIKPNDKNTMTILQNNTKYVFHIRELISCFKNCLNHSNHFFIEPIVCKNPYTNIPFNKSSLYNIYFAIRDSTFITPTEIHQFFLCDFNISDFAIKNEEFLSINSLKTFVNNNCKMNIRKYVDLMFKTYEIDYKIDPSYPKDLLFQYMRPYLILFYQSLYSPRCSQRNCSSRKLYLRLRLFCELNPCFGRKKVLFTAGSKNPFSRKCRKLVSSFDEVVVRHKNQSIENISNIFMNSHLCKKDFDNREIPFYTTANSRSRIQFEPISTLRYNDEEDSVPDLISDSETEEEEEEPVIENNESDDDSL